MALTRCPECGGEVSTGAATCPHCGYAFRDRVVEEPVREETVVVEKRGGGCGGVIAALVIILLLALAAAWYFGIVHFR